MNHKKLYRIYCEEGLSVKRRRGRKRARGGVPTSRSVGRLRWRARPPDGAGQVHPRPDAEHALPGQRANAFHPCRSGRGAGHFLARTAFSRPLARDRSNGRFFAGDIGQRIFRAPFPWKAARGM